MEYRREIEGLRAIAVLPIILFHAGFEFFSGGFIGVDVFFVISGYVITSKILTDLRTETFALLTFYERRARRILPALYLVIVLTLPFAWLWLLPQDLKGFSQSVTAASTSASNFYFYLTSGYFDTSSELKPLIHTWSLAVEEQFYLVYPVLVALCFKISKRRFDAILLGLMLLSFALTLYLSNKSPAFAFYMFPTRAFELLIGALVAIQMEKEKTTYVLKSQTKEIAGAAGLLITGYALIAFGNEAHVPGVRSLIPTLGTGLIILFATKHTWAGRVLGNRFLTGIGLLSYGAYLWHQPLLALTRIQTGETLSRLTSCALIGSTFVLAYLSWRFVEAPFRNKAYISTARFLAIVTSGGVALTFLGLFGHYQDGFESRFKTIHDGDIGHHSFYKQYFERYFPCKDGNRDATGPRGNGLARCRKSKQENEIDAVLLGDSHAEHLFVGLAEHLTTKNLAAYVSESNPFPYNESYETLLKHVVNNKNIKTIFIAAYWYSRTKEIPSTSDLESQLMYTLTSLTDAGKSVYLVDDIPRFTFRSERCKFGRADAETSKCDTRKSEILDYEIAYVPTLRRVVAAIPSVRMITLRDYFCDEMICSMLKGGQLMYRDNNHLNIEGSRYLGKQIVTNFPELNW